MNFGDGRIDGRYDLFMNRDGLHDLFMNFGDGLHERFMNFGDGLHERFMNFGDGLHDLFMRNLHFNVVQDVFKNFGDNIQGTTSLFVRGLVRLFFVARTTIRGKGAKLPFVKMNAVIEFFNLTLTVWIQTSMVALSRISKLAANAFQKIRKLDACLRKVLFDGLHAHANVAIQLATDATDV